MAKASIERLTVTIGELAKVCGISPNTAYNYVTSGDFVAKAKNAYPLVKSTNAYFKRIRAAATRLWLAGDRTGTSEVIAELPGFPDNLGAGNDGIVWVAFASEPNPALESLHRLQLFLRRLAARLPKSVLPKPSRVAWVAAYDERGACVHDFKWTDGGYAMVTGVCRVGRRMWCAGLQERALMRFDLPG